MLYIAPMRFLLIFLVAGPIFASVNYDFDLVCAFESATRYQEIVRFEQKARDKFRHCTISCAVGIDCGASSSVALGVSKEIFDIFGPGNVELMDLAADLKGLRIARRESVKGLDSCFDACNEFYPPN